MAVLKKLTIVEAKLFGRDLPAVFFGLLFPALLLFVLGAFMPGFRDPTDDLGGLRPVDVYAPIVLAFALVTAGISTLPTYLASYRERGGLRRLALTPARPSRLLLALVVVQLGTALLAAVTAIVVAVIAFGIDPPQHPVGFLVAFLLAGSSLFAIGFVVGVVAPSTSAATGLGLLLYFPLLFFAGVWFPRDAMADGLRAVSDATPIGAGVQALQDAWFGAAPAASNLAVMAAFAIVAGLLAVRLFRWE